MKLGTVRVIAGIICAAATAAMIVSAILAHIGAVITFGLVASFAILATMVATTVVRAETQPRQGDLAELSAELETSINQVINSERVDDADVRQVVRLAVKLGSTMGPRGSL